MTEKQTPQWLQDLQESSWELEFLISGGAIFTLIQASQFLTESVQSLHITNEIIGRGLLLIFAMLGIEVLTLGFILHLLLRAFWVALVCANYVYPEGVQTKKIKWKRPFRVNIQEGSDLYELILKTNKLCSTVMYLSIISSILILGLLLIALVFVTLPTILFNTQESPYWDSYFGYFSWVCLFYLLDLVFFGVLRKIPILSYVVFPFFWLFDFISLRFVYQKALWLYNTNVTKWKFATVAGAFLVLAFFYSYAGISKTMHWDNIFDQSNYRSQLAPNQDLRYSYYKDELGDEKPIGAVIPSKIIDKDLLELFIVYRKRFDQDFKKLGGKHPYISDLVKIRINDSIYQKLEWFPTWNRDNDQLGITTMIPIKDLPNGKHLLVLESTIDTTQSVVIPFWKQKD